MADRGRDTSYELTEVRTVLSRAETALKAIEAWPQSFRESRWKAWNTTVRPGSPW